MTAPDARRRAAVVGGVVLAAALIGWLAWPGRPAAGDAGGPGGSTPVAADATGAPAPAPIDARGAAAAVVPPDVHGPEERQVCGGGWVKVGADGQVEGDPPDLAPAVAALRKRLVEKLRNDRDDRARAVGLWMDDPGGAALVDLALGTRDPAVYGFAFRTCHGPAVVAGSPCSLLNAAQWARLDPGNAAPWLYALGEADARKDVPGVEEALFQIGRSARNAMGHFQPLLPLIDAAPADDASLMAAFGVVSEAMGRVAAMGLPYVSPLVTACRGPALADANRRQLCGRVADVLVDRSDDLVNSYLGAGMITRLTGASDRRDLQRAERDEWSAAMLANFESADALGCKVVRSMLDRLREQAAFGENGAMRRWLDQSGLTPKQLVARAAERDARRAAAAAAAASAAAALLAESPPGAEPTAVEASAPQPSAPEPAASGAP